VQVVAALYADPLSGYPPKYARDSIPHIKGYADGQTTPTPSGTDYKPGALLGCVSGELGLRKFLEARGHKLVVTSDKDGEDSTFEKEMVDAEIVISQVQCVSDLATWCTVSQRVALCSRFGRRT
jgi:formate dehydrogenase